MIPGSQSFHLGPKKAQKGVLLLHGFTSTPDSVREFGAFLARRGFLVSGPLLAGHGTTWQELGRTPWTAWREDAETAYHALKKQVKKVFCAGLSMGADLCLDLAASHREIAGLSLVNNALHFRDWRIHLARFMKFFLPSDRSVGSDIRDPDRKEIAYERTPTAGAAELLKLALIVRKRLPLVTCPTLLFKSREDHVIPPVSATFTYNRIASARKELVWLGHSYHVATMDFDREEIFEKTAEWFKSAESPKRKA